MERTDRKFGLLSAVPITVILLLSFAAPLVVISVFSIMPQKVFSLANVPDFSAYGVFFRQGYYQSLFWALGMALASTILLFFICWPLAFAMAKVFKRFTLVITIAVVITLFVSENIRLFGWVLTLMKGRVDRRATCGPGPDWSFDGALYNVPIIVYSAWSMSISRLCCFPWSQGISMVPDDARQAAADLGATRWQIFREIELPLSAPGIVIGSLLCFVLAAGALAESKLLGRADRNRHRRRSGNRVHLWPELAARFGVVHGILILIIGSLAVFGVNRVDLDKIMGRKR